MESGNSSMWLIIALFIFGIFYNAAVAHLERQPGGHEGFTSLLVAVGVSVTVASLCPLIGPRNVLLVLLAFGASGTPMIMGSIRRYMQARSREIEELRGMASEELRSIASVVDGDDCP